MNKKRHQKTRFWLMLLNILRQIFKHYFFCILCRKSCSYFSDSPRIRIFKTDGFKTHLVFLILLALQFPPTLYVHYDCKVEHSSLYHKHANNLRKNMYRRQPYIAIVTSVFRVFRNQKYYNHFRKVSSEI